jgi:putative addiction module component (TIGR02574 family)
MPKLMQTLGIEHLSIEDREQLIDELYESLASDEPDLSPEVLAEINRRIAEIDAHPETLKTRTEVEATLRARVSR